jgi:hypothetical protein
VSHALQASTQVSWWQIHLSVAAGPHITCAGCCPPYQTPPLYGPQDVEIPYKHHGFSGLCLEMFFFVNGAFFLISQKHTNNQLEVWSRKKNKTEISFQEYWSNIWWMMFDAELPDPISWMFTQWKDYFIPLMLVKQESTICQITIHRWYKPLPNGWFILVLPTLLICGTVPICTCIYTSG